MLAPAGTPRGVIERLNGEIVRMLTDPAIVERLVSQGIEVTPSTPEAFQALIVEHRAKWASVVTAAGVRAE
jgi:tripartite-type tricarboxylate transporter receptor subunit TctC